MQVEASSAKLLDDIERTHGAQPRRILRRRAPCPIKLLEKSLR